MAQWHLRVAREIRDVQELGEGREETWMATVFYKLYRPDSVEQEAGATWKVVPQILFALSLLLRGLVLRRSSSASM